MLWLKQQFPLNQFAMIVGEDAFNDIRQDKWKEVGFEYSNHSRVPCYGKAFISKCYDAKEWIVPMHPSQRHGSQCIKSISSKM